jgi:serine/threonine protein phosphatase 1
MARTFVVGDIHGAYKALMQCLQRSNFDYENDHLISLGDVADGWPETKACIDELLKIRNLTYILGNHDFWTLEWMENNLVDPIWYDQGGKATMDSYSGEVPHQHLQFLKHAFPYFISDNRLFVHAGIQPEYPIEEQTIQTLMWSRDLAKLAYQRFLESSTNSITMYNEVYIGHTPVPFSYPIKGSEVWMMDTGAGWSGVLSMMEVNSKEVFTSDEVPSLYPGITGRKRKQ